MKDFVTIVSGLPRSGTSMMMAMLDAGGIPAVTDKIRSADIDNPGGYFEFEPVKQVREDSSWLKDLQGKVVKMVYMLLYDLPDEYEYRVVFMRRDLEEVIKSQEQMLGRLSKGHQAPANLLMDVFGRHLERVDRWLSEQPNFKVIYVDYGEVLAHPRLQAGIIDRFLDSGLNITAMARVPDRSLHRQRAEQHNQVL